MKPRPRTVVLVVLGALVVAGGAQGPELLRRVVHRRALARLVAVVQSGSDEERAAAEAELVGFEDPEALLALIGAFRDERTGPRRNPQVADEPSALPAPDPLRWSVELFAVEPEPRDPRPKAALEQLEKLTRDEPGGDAHFWALYLLDELESPRYPREPDGFASPRARIRATWAHVLDEVRAAGALPIDSVPGAGEDAPSVVWTDELVPIDETPWRALVRLTQRRFAGARVEGGRVRLIARAALPDDLDVASSGALHERLLDRHDGTTEVLDAEPPTVFFHDPPRLSGVEDPAKVFRALAKIEGLALERVDERHFRARAEGGVAAVISRCAVALEEGAAFREDVDTSSYVEFLLALDEPEATLALLDAFAARGTDVFDGHQLIRAIELHATGPTDPRVRARLEAIATGGLSRINRFAACYCLEELDAPRFPKAPPSFVGERRWPDTRPELDTIAAIASATGFELRVDPSVSPESGSERGPARPWRALLLLADENSHVAVSGHVISIDEREDDGDASDAFDTARKTPCVPADFRELELLSVPSPRKGARAFAALAGVRFVERPDGSYVYEPASRSK